MKQLSVENFFKSKSSSLYCSTSMDDHKTGATKRRSLSLKKNGTPNKCPRVSFVDKNVSEVVDLCSDDENVSPTFTSETPSDNKSNSSQSTIIYSLTPTSPQDCPQVHTPLSTDLDKVKHIDTVSQTQTPSGSGLRIKSPRSINKYFSPSKKRTVFKKTPVKRNLNQEFSNTQSPSSNDVFDVASVGLDDKTIFLLKIIYDFLGNSSLKCLLKEDSQNLLKKSLSVMKPGMKLVCRLFWYKDGWYKLSKIKHIMSSNKMEIDDPLLFEVLTSLVDNGFIITSNPNNGGEIMTFDDYAKVLDMNELKEICKEYKLKFNTRKGALDSLQAYCRTLSINSFFTKAKENNTNRVLKNMAARAGKCYKLSELAQRTIFRLYNLMFLGIDYSLIKEKKLELTLIYDKIKRETYPIEDGLSDNASVVFKNNEEFERYIKALLVYENYMEETDLSTKCEIVNSVFRTFKNYTEEEMLRYKSFPMWLLRFTPLNFYVKTLESGIQDLKREQKYDLVLDILSSLISQDLFRQHKKADWYAEKALVLSKVNQCDEAAKVLLEGFKSDLSDEAKDILCARAKKMAKLTSLEEVETELINFADKEYVLENNLKGVYIHKQPMDRSDTRGKLKFESRTEEGRIVQDVEEFCLSHYIKEGKFIDGKHWEGRIITTLFFLLFWDIIYSKPLNCVGIFLNRFQKYPLDLFCKSFYSNRKEMIDERIKRLESMPIEEILEIMQDIWTSRPETEHSGIVREGISWQEISAVAACLGGKALAAITGRLARDYRYSHSGFPDLTLWNLDTKEIRFVEVKSDSDKPSMKQIQWMHYLQQNSIDTEFCYVGVHTTKSKTRAQ